MSFNLVVSLREQELLNAIKLELDRSIENVDVQTQSRLTEIRYQAIQRKKIIFLTPNSSQFVSIRLN